MQKSMNESLNRIPLINAIKRLDPQERDRIQDEIHELAKPDADYYVFTFISGIIITLGLLIDSEATVIGGMVISPLFWPICSLALAMMEGKKLQLRQSVITLFNSFVLTCATGMVFGWLIPYDAFGTVINNLTKPTVFDLLIAIFAGLGGAYTVVYSKKSAAALFGVAIATVLVPPISVAGIMLGSMNIDKATGALLLFAMSFMSALLTALFIFTMGHFTKVDSDVGKKRRRKALTWSVASFFLILIPISVLSWTAITNSALKQEVSTIFAQTFSDKTIEQLELINEKSYYTIQGNVYADGSLPKENLQTFANKLSTSIGKPVHLQLQIIPYQDQILYSEQ